MKNYWDKGISFEKSLFELNVVEMGGIRILISGGDCTVLRSSFFFFSDLP